MRFMGTDSLEVNSKLRVAFDCDGTLLTCVGGEPRQEIIDMYNMYKALGCVMIVWSGGGEDYAAGVARRLGLEPDCVRSKMSGMKVDIAIDDLGMGPGHCNVCIRV